MILRWRALEGCMTAACETVLGYDQPVEEKPLGADVSDSEESEADGGND